MIQAIAFDLDGTLVDSVPDLAWAANNVRSQRGLEPLTLAQLRQFVGDGVSALLQRALSFPQLPDVPVVNFTEALADFHRYYAAHLAHHSQLYPSVNQTLAALKQAQIPMIVVTNKPELHSRNLLTAFNLNQYFEDVIGGDTLPTRKPAPEPLWEAARRLQVAPEQLLMVGDSQNDWLAAQAAGCPCCLVDYGYGLVTQLPALAHWQRLEQLLDWLTA